MKRILSALALAGVATLGIGFGPINLGSGTSDCSWGNSTVTLPVL